MIGKQRKLVRAEVHAVAREQSTTVHAAFSDSLAGDVNRFRLLRRLRKLVPNADIDTLIFDEATPLLDGRRR